MLSDHKSPRSPSWRTRALNTYRVIYKLRSSPLTGGSATVTGPLARPVGTPICSGDEATEHLVVIDHNLAFDQSLETTTFMDSHAFASVIPALRANDRWQAACRQGCRDARATFDLALSEIPDTWWYHDAEQTVPATFNSETARQQLRECETDGFWPWER